MFRYVIGSVSFLGFGLSLHGIRETGLSGESPSDIVVELSEIFKVSYQVLLAVFYIVVRVFE